MIKYSDMLEEVLNLYPEEISCEDAKPIGTEGMHWDSLHQIQDRIDEENNYFEEGNEILTVLLWSVLIGINEGFKQNFTKYHQYKKINVRQIIDLDETKRQFMENIQDTYWQNYLKEKGETIVFD